ncbi:hypothetical protein [Limimaricola cinnabarinus]|uniref:hypothetical protein n=1 Tax=Limimaricola cinnabarinus TaxID=1125964 RepID=UPI0005ECF997|nr:hypothetical protein [Limimaricola cinnabarinus]
MSSKLGGYVPLKPIRTPKIPKDDPFLPSVPATLHAKAEVTLSAADGLPHWQPKAVINLTLP